MKRAGAYLDRYGPALALAVAAVLRLVAAWHRPLHIDEGVSLEVGAMPLNRIIPYLHTYDAHPLLTFMLIHALLGAQAPIMLIRTVFALMGVASVWVFMAIVRTWSTPRAAVVAGLTAACMPDLVFYDSWIRMYAPAMLLELLAFWLLSILATQTLSGRRRILMRIAWILVNAVALYTLYLTGMAIAAQLLFAATRRRPFLFETLLDAVIAGVLWLPQLPTMLSQQAAGGMAFAGLQTHLGVALAQLPAQATVGPDIEGWAAGLAAALVWLWIALTVVCGWSRLRTTLLPWLAVPTLLTVAYSLITHKFLYDGKYHLLLGYALSAATGVAVAALAERSRGAIGGAAVVLLALSVTGAQYAFNPFFYTADWPRVADVVRADARPGDLILLEPGPGNYALQYYLDERPYRILWVTSGDEVARALSLIPRERRVWLIGSGIKGVDPQLRVVGALQSRFHLATFEEITRAQPNQDVEVGLFVR